MVEAKGVEAQVAEAQGVEAQVVEAKVVEDKAVEAKVVKTKIIKAKVFKDKAFEAKVVKTKVVEAKVFEDKAVEAMDNLSAWLDILIKREETDHKDDTTKIKIKAQISKPPFKDTIIIQKAMKKQNKLKTKTILGVAKNSKGQILYKMKETLSILILTIFWSNLKSL